MDKAASRIRLHQKEHFCGERHCTLSLFYYLTVCVLEIYRCTLKTREFRIKDFFVCSARSFERLEMQI